MTQAITAILPSFIFSTRRTNSGLDAANNNNPAVALMNWNIATAQMFKAGKETANAAKGVKTAIAAKITSAEEAIKNLACGDKVMEGAAKVVGFTSEHINPLICATGAVKVACSDDKQSAAIQETIALSGMFGFEKSAKILLGLPQKKWVNGKRVKFQEESLLKKLTQDNVFIQKQIECLKDYAKTSEFMEKAVKYAPGVLKGLGFVCASIAGYTLGSYVGEKVANYVSEKQNKTAKEIKFNSPYVSQNSAKEVQMYPQLNSLTRKSA